MTSYCTIHQIEMKQFEKDGRTWYSHKADDGTWCKGEGLGKAERRGDTEGYKKFQAVGQTIKAEANWEAKDRTSIAQTASNASATLLAAKANVLGETITDEAFEHTADFIYNWIMGKRGRE